MIYDILEYISSKDCNGHKLIPCVKVSNKTLSYTIEIHTDDGFRELYTLEQEDMYRIETVRFAVDRIIKDFRNKYTAAQKEIDI